MSDTTTERVRVFRVRPACCDEWMVFDDLPPALDTVAGLMRELSAGEAIEVACGEMSRSDHDAMPEHGGW